MHTTVAERSIDFVLYEAGESPKIAVRLSVQHKTIMTAHGKARKNRYGDIIAYSNHMHNHNRKCIAGAIVIVNVSPLYENPDAFAGGLLISLTIHGLSGIQARRVRKGRVFV